MGKEIWCSKCGILTYHECVDVVVKKFMGEDWREETWECQSWRTKKDTSKVQIRAKERFKK